MRHRRAERRLRRCQDVAHAHCRISCPALCHVTIGECGGVGAFHLAWSIARTTSRVVSGSWAILSTSTACRNKVPCLNTILAWRTQKFPVDPESPASKATPRSLRAVMLLPGAAYNGERNVTVRDSSPAGLHVWPASVPLGHPVTRFRAEARRTWSRCRTSPASARCACRPCAGRPVPW
jgi:hypothetical protein